MKKKPQVIVKKSRKIPELEVLFIPEPTLCKPGFAHGITPQKTVKAKIKYEKSWKL